MGKHKEQLRYEFNHTPTTMLMAVFGGACGFMTVESFFEDIMNLLSYRTNKVHAWQVHMGSVCVGIIAFIAFLFILEVFETRSKAIAWRSSWPWLPLAGLAAISTVVCIPFYFVALIGAIYGVWAYRRTNSVRRSTRLT
jgi:hypothetical protein